MYNQGPGVSPPKPHTFLPGPLWHARFSHEKKNLQGLDVPLTDRETQILVPNIVERSGALTVFSHDPDGNRNGMQQ